jgi:hypothetical protein
MLAHAGHWLTNLIYVVPVIALIGYLGWQSLRDRRAGLAEPEEQGSAAGEP